MNLLREPLLQFAVAGAVLFGGYALISRSGGGAAPAQAVHIGEGEIGWLKQTFASQWRRPPTPDELTGLVHGLLEEELLAREARALGLDQNDTIVRRRLAQKLMFLVDETSHVIPPTEDELRQFYAANSERFRSPGRISFAHIFFDPTRRQHPDSDAQAVLVSVAAPGASAADAAGLGDPLLLESQFRDADRQTVTNLFGADFADAVFALKPGQWGGPLRSGYGLHLVRVSNVSLSTPKPFDEVRPEVLHEWENEQERKGKEAYLAKLTEKYGVVVDDSVKSLLQRPPAREAPK
jgi:hypothetical protein